MGKKCCTRKRCFAFQYFAVNLSALKLSDFKYFTRDPYIGDISLGGGYFGISYAKFLHVATKIVKFHFLLQGFPPRELNTQQPVLVIVLIGGNSHNSDDGHAGWASQYGGKNVLKRALLPAPGVLYIPYSPMEHLREEFWC